MGSRSTVYNAGLTDNWEEVSRENKELLRDFIGYCRSTNHSPQTCYQYESQIKIFLCYVEKRFSNKSFVDIKKREYITFFGDLQNEYNMSPNRVASIKSAIASMGNYIVDILDEEYPSFKNNVKSIKLASKQNVRPKTIMEEEDVKNCLDALVAKGKYEVACFFAFLVYSGARKAEAIQARVDDFTDKTVVLHGKYWATHIMRTKGKGKEGKPLRKYVEIAGFKPYLDLWLKRREELNIMNEELFTVYRQGEYIAASIPTANSFAKTIGDIMGKEYHNHCARHFYTTRARRNKVPDSIIQGLVGWSDLSLLEVYDDREKTETLEEWFKDNE